MTTIIFSKLCGPTIRDKIPSPEPFGQWTYMYHDKTWYWVQTGQRKRNFNGSISYAKDWVRVPNENHVPKEHRLYVLLLG